MDQGSSVRAGLPWAPDSRARPPAMLVSDRPSAEDSRSTSNADEPASISRRSKRPSERRFKSHAGSKPDRSNRAHRGVMGGLQNASVDRRRLEPLVRRCASTHCRSWFRAIEWWGLRRVQEVFPDPQAVRSECESRENCLNSNNPHELTTQVTDERSCLATM